MAGNNDEPRQVRCVRCGRFLGFEMIRAGGIMLKCKCGQWTVVKVEENLTLTGEPDKLRPRTGGQ